MVCRIGIRVLYYTGVKMGPGHIGMRAVALFCRDFCPDGAGLPIGWVGIAPYASHQSDFVLTEAGYGRARTAGVEVALGLGRYGGIYVLDPYLRWRV